MRSCGGDDVDDDGVSMNTMNTQRLCRPQVWWRRGFSSAWLNEPTSGWRTEACRFGILQSTESPATISHLMKRPPPFTHKCPGHDLHPSVSDCVGASCRTGQKLQQGRFHTSQKPDTSEDRLIFLIAQVVLLIL